MPTGQEIYEVLEARAAEGASDPIRINSCDFTDLQKLTEVDFVEIGFDEGRAERMAEALSRSDATPIMEHLNIELVIDPHAPGLLD